MKPAFTYSALVSKVVDGDTIDFMIDLGFNCHAHVRTRLNGIDTPEVSTQAGKDVRDLVRTLLPAGKKVTVKTFKDPSDKYGRWLAELWTDSLSTSFNQWLIDQGHAKPYDGGKK